jgi:predicted kinase
MAGINRYERHLDEPNTGLYSPERIHMTYEKVMEKASSILSMGENVVVDATFQKKKFRDMARNLANNVHAKLIMIECVAPDNLVKQWLEKRMNEKTASDGRWEIYKEQKKVFEPFSKEEYHIIFDMSISEYDVRIQKYKELFDFISTL